MNVSRPRLRALAVTTALVAGFFSVTAAAAGSAATPVQGAASAAPQAIGSASGFSLFLLPGPQPACSGTASDTTGDPYLDRSACGFVDFSVAGVTGPLSAELYGEGSSSPFATPAVGTPTGAPPPEERRVSLRPTGTWPAGAIRLVIKDATGPIGEFTFFLNTLRATFTNGAESKQGDPFDVSGTIEMHSARATFSDTGVKAPFTLKVSKADGTVLGTIPVPASDVGSDGTFTKTVPASLTNINSGPESNYRTTIAVRAVDASYTDSTPVVGTGDWGARDAGAGNQTIVSPATELTLRNSFVSSVGWVKPGEKYPSSISLTNPTDAPVTPTDVTITAPTGSTILTAGGVPVNDTTYTWTPGELATGDTKTLVLESQAATTSTLGTIVWRDLSTTAVLRVPGKTDKSATAHGPKVVPPNETFETARYGDRPFPVVPVQYLDRDYEPQHSGDSLESVLNDPANPGSTFNLYQEMSLSQLFPNGTVPSAGIASRGFDNYPPGFTFTQASPSAPQNTCHGITLPNGVAGTPLYSERITNGVYNLPGQTEYYGSDSFGSAYVTAQTPAGIQDIDSGCGETGKLVYDAAAIADPEIDYSDYDTDKDGVVDFFMVVFAGCGGNGSSQLASPITTACPYDDAPYDNIWPHSSTLEGGYKDPVTKLPGYTTDDQLKDLEGRPLFYTDGTYSDFGPEGDPAKPVDNTKPVFVRVGPYNVNPETAIDKASVISHEYGHSLGLPDFYSGASRETYGDWTLMATDKSQNMDAFGRQELGWVVPEVLDSSRTEANIPNSKVDIGSITWQEPDGDPYTLTDGVDGTVHNSQMYVAKLPGRQLLDDDVFSSGDGASPNHLWWSGSGNDFNCPPVAGHNLDIVIPELKSLDPAATVTLSFKNRWDMEWDYDYGFVMTTTDGGANYTSHESENGYTTGTNTVPPAQSHNACQDTYSNGLTGSSGSYAGATPTFAADRVQNNNPEPVFLEDSYDISDLVGQARGALRFAYVTDPGVSRPGWFIDDVVITVDPDGDSATDDSFDVYKTDFESSGTPADTRIFNGGCREDLTSATKCTKGWRYLTAGAASDQDHAYYMEMRDRSGFDFEGHNQIDRDPLGFQPGFYLAYTDETHGYGNTGVDDPPAQSPLDSNPQPGEAAPNLNDAAFIDVANRASYTDNPTTPHVDNYSDPSSDTGEWKFGYNCLTFNVNSMTGEETVQLAGDLSGAVTFNIGAGCSDFDYGYLGAGSTPGASTKPTAKAKATPANAEAGEQVKLSADGSTDTETPNNLDYSWDFGDGGTTKDAVGKNAKTTYSKAGTYTATVTVTDPQGLRDVASATVTVTAPQKPVARLKLKPKKPFINAPVSLSAQKSTGNGPLKYSWNFGDGGTTEDAKGVMIRPRFRKAGYRTLTLTVTDDRGRSDSASQKILVRRAVKCRSSQVERTGSWRQVSSLNAPNGQYCDNLGNGRGPDTLTYRFKGPQVDVYHGRSRDGGHAAVYVDGRRVGTVSFRSSDATPRFKFHQVFKNLGKGPHTVRLVVLSGQAYVASFITIR
jgi:M6 family metalloprotease-like protein